MQLFYLSSPNYFTQNVLGPLEQLELCNKTIINHLVQNRGELSYHKHVVFNHIKYFLGDMICYESDQNILFGQIKHLIANQKKLIFFLNKYKTINYVDHFRAYRIEPQPNDSNVFISFDAVKNNFRSIYIILKVTILLY